MKSKEEIIGFYEKNRMWLEMLVANAEYPRILRAAAAAVLEVGIEERDKKNISRGEIK